MIKLIGDEQQGTESMRATVPAEPEQQYLCIPRSDDAAEATLEQEEIGGPNNAAGDNSPSFSSEERNDPRPHAPRGHEVGHEVVHPDVEELASGAPRAADPPASPLNERTAAFGGRLITYRDIVSRTLPAVDWVIEGLIARRETAVGYGPPGSMKTWLFLGLALACAAGKRWLDRFPIPKKQKVLYIDMEMPEPTLRRRIKRLGLGMGLDLEAELPFRALSQPRFVQFDGSWPHRLLREASGNWSFDPEVIIVDSLRRVLVGSENNADEVAKFWSNAAILTGAGKTLILTHHTRKAGINGKGDAQERASGSTYIVGGADVSLCIDRAAGDVSVVEMTKARSAEEIDPFAFRFVDDGPPDGPVRVQFEGSRPGSGTKISKKERAKEFMRTFLAGKPDRKAPAGEIHAYVVTQGIGRRTSEEALREMGSSGEVIQPAGESGMHQLVKR
jgi:AAA domain